MMHLEIPEGPGTIPGGADTMSEMMARFHPQGGLPPAPGLGGGLEIPEGSPGVLITKGGEKFALVPLGLGIPDPGGMGGLGGVLGASAIPAGRRPSDPPPPGGGPA